MLAGLRASGALEQDADIVAFIYRNGSYNPESFRQGRGGGHRGRAPSRAVEKASPDSPRICGSRPRSALRAMSRQT
jgi:replicative DNA helicase